MHICVIEDQRTTLNVIKSVLGRVEEYRVEGFSDPHQALVRCAETVFDLVLVDYKMPGMDGIACLKHLRKMPNYEMVPIIMLTADNDREVRLESVRSGAADFLNKPFDPEELRVRVKNLLSLRQAQLALADRARHLDQEVKWATKKLLETEEELIWRLARAIEVRDGNTGAHISRVASVSATIARHMGLSERFCELLYLATPLHDTGKIGIPDQILNKPGRLSDEEMKIVRKHTDVGARLLEDGRSELIHMAHEIALSHHEKWDGTGYNRGLKGQEIPISGRIVAIADVLDALCSERPYKKAWTFEDACAEILSQSGSHFDPDCIAAFEAGKQEIADIYRAPSQIATVA